MSSLYELVTRVDRALGRRASLCFVGLGISSLSLLEDLPQDGRRITLRCDGRVYPPAWAKERFCSIRVGERCLDDLCEDLLVLSPSVRRERPEIARAISRGALTTSDAELFFDGRRGITLGVTGSDGKSTAVAYAAEMIRSSGGNASEVGNIGLPFCRAGDGIAVAELSSFMLRYMTPPLDGALITSVSPDHLNWHEDYEEYKRAKLAIWARAERIILCADDPVTSEAIGKLRPFAVYSLRRGFRELWDSYHAEVCYSLEGGYICENGTPLIHTEGIRRREYYNLLNLMGALGLTVGHRTSEGARRAAESFSGLAHRSMPIRVLRGVSYVDSSIDTSPTRCAATLRSLDSPVLLLLGGRGKGLSFEPMLGEIAGRVRRVAIYGEAAEELSAALAAFPDTENIPRECFSRFDEAVAQLAACAESGDTVLLSPAATAYGEFGSFAERGERFAEIVRGLT